MLKELLDTFGITSHQFKIFLFTFITVAIMVGLQQLGIHSPIPVSFP